jgi:hypothetical protein
MATALHIAGRGGLSQWGLDPSDRRNVERLLFLTDDMRYWMDNTLTYLAPDRGRDISPYEQVVAMFEHFVGTPTFTGVGYFQLLIPQFDGVYEMKMTDVRVFGWFPAKSNFIAAYGDMKSNLKKNQKLVTTHIGNTVNCRQIMDLDEPKFITGPMHEIL